MNTVNFKEKRIVIGSLILLLVIGFAAVTTTLLINGNARIGENSDDFKIYFSKVIENNIEKNELITNEDKTIIDFDVRLVNVGETYILDYEITNSSRNYDGNFEIVYHGDKSEYYTIKNEIDNSTPLKAQEKRMGMITIELVKGYVGEEDLDLDISYELVFSPIERDHLAVVVEPIKIATGHCSNDDCEEDDYRQKSVWGKWNHKFSLDLVEKIVIKDTNDVPSDVIDSWDASASGNGSIMGYALDEDNNGLVELYLGQNGGVIANEDSSWLFGGFSNLKTIEGLENLDTSNAVNMTRMFYRCFSLTSLDLSSFDTSQVNDMYEMFRGCENLISLNINNFDTSNVADMTSMFYGCSNLTSLDLSNFDTSNVVNMTSMFTSCLSLTSLDLSNFDTSNFAKMTRMFYECLALTSLNVSSFDTKNVTKMDYMFYGGSSLMTLNLSNFDTSQVTDMSWMFANCSSLTSLNIKSVDIPDSVWGNSGMFRGLPESAKILVKDEKTQQWILALDSNNRPSAWTTENVIVAT